MRPGLLAAVHRNDADPERMAARAGGAPGSFVWRVRSRTDTDPAREADDR